MSTHDNQGPRSRTAAQRAAHPVSIAQQLWRATSESDSESIRSVLSPDVVWQTFSRGALSGALQGPDAVLDLFARTGELVDYLTSELLDVYASPHGAVLRYRVDAGRGPRAICSEVLLVLRIDEGLVTEASSVPVDASQGDAFWMAN